MAKTFAASVRDFASRTKEAMDDVLRSSVEDVVNDIRANTQDSYKTRSGPAQQGLIPLDQGFLRNAMASDLNGSGEFQAVDPPPGGGAGPDGSVAVTLSIQEMGAGDYLHVAFTAAYAHRINSGFVGTDSLGRTYEQSGVHFIERGADGWEEAVRKNAEALKP